MTSIERISEMLKGAGKKGQLFPPTFLYNEGWLLRLVLDCLSRQSQPVEWCPIKFADGRSKWYSEVLLPSQFLARKHVGRNDPLAEHWTRADGVIGHVVLGNKGLADISLSNSATQLIVIEAKLFSRLSRGVTKAPYFDQAARSVACIAELLFKAKRQPEQEPFSSLCFYIVAPQEQKHFFSSELSKDSIESKVSRRVSEYHEKEKEEWFKNSFLPTWRKITVDFISWEELLRYKTKPLMILTSFTKPA